jgi:spermidine synthase
MTSNRLRNSVLVLLFLSGFSSLVYEVTWMRLLSLAFGVSIYATTAVLTAYMGGLALGSWLLGRLGGRRGRDVAQPASLLRIYALLELGVGIFAIFTPLIFSALTALVVWLARQFSPDFYTYNLMRFGLSAVVLLIPTILMGGTFPVISQLLARRESRQGAELGNLYAVNTFGGVLGTFCAGLFFIRLFGTSNTITLAAILDGLVALGAFYYSRQSSLFVEASRPKRRDRRSPSRPAVPSGNPLLASSPSLILWAYALSGFIALGYEVVWTRLLAIFSLNAIFSFTIMLTTFLIGLTVGSRLAAQWVDRSQHPLRLFGSLQLGIGVSGIGVLFVFAQLPALQEKIFQGVDFGTQVTVEFFSAAITMIAPTILMGAAFPVAARLYTASTLSPEGRERAGVGERIGQLYALNTVGSTLGSLVAGFVLISFLGLQRAALTLALLNLALGVGVMLAARALPKWQLSGAVLAALLGIFLLPTGIYLGRDEPSQTYLIFYREGIDATVSVFEDKDAGLKVSFVNGRSEVPTDAESMRAFRFLGNLPPLLEPEARSVLMVSFGNGIASGAMSRHPIEKIESVELVAEQVEAARLFTQENRAVLNYPGLHITIEDGRNFLLRSDETYDIITVDATHPINTSSWALFTREFYRLARQRLQADGIIIQWLPFHDLAEKDYRAIVKTFQSVFPHTTLWYTGAIHTFLVGTPQPLARADVLTLDALIRERGVADDLGGAQQLAGYYLMDESAVKTYTAESGTITDDRAFFLPALEMEAVLRGLAAFAEK